MEALRRWGGPAAVLGGALWVLLWGAFLLTHGPGPEDNKRMLLALTWIDYSKLVVLPLALFALGLVSLYPRPPAQPPRAAAIGLILSLAALGLIAVGTVLYLWPAPWGTYVGVDWEAPFTVAGGILVSLATLVLLGGLALFGPGLWRARAMPAWAAVLLIVGALTLVPWLHMTMLGGVFGVVWLLLGYTLWSGRLAR